jgi:GNAT superfamily N-acetyltransferase
VAELESDLPELEQGTIIGTCGLELFRSFPGTPGFTTLIEGDVRAAGADCSLERLYVLPKARNLGIGSALLRTAIKKGLEEKRTRMEIWSDKKLTLAHELYERFGAIRVGERICDDPDESPEWGMALELKPELLVSRRQTH